MSAAGLGILAIAAALLAGAAAWFLQGCVYEAYRRRERMRQACTAADGAGQRAGPQRGGRWSAEDALIDRMERMSRSLDARKDGRFSWIYASAARIVDASARTAGVAATVTAAGLSRVRSSCAVTLAALGALAGVLFSGELAALLACAGAVAGWRAPAWALRQRSRQRAEELERHLPEMLEVLALGLQSGLSFDRSLQLYASHFDTLLAQSCAAAYGQWSVGLITREEALRALAASYDSALFARVVGNIVRSLQFGTALAESLRAAAAEARSAYAARKQEQVAKVSVKMMVPTATLMLPSMLLLVLGPVLLELAQGI